MTVAGWAWAAARSRGVSHVRANIRVQDAFKCFTTGGDGLAFVAIVSDGAGSASHGGEGASLVCRTFATRARQHFARATSLPDLADVTSWLDDTRDLLSAVATRRELLARDFAATVILVVSTGNASIVFHVGDGCAVFQNVGSDQWRAPIWPEHGEYASTTAFVTDDAAPLPRFVRHDEGIDGLVMFSDGLERLALDFRIQQPHGPFFNRVITPVRNSTKSGRNAHLSRQLADFLDSADINARTDDDKTMVLAVKR
jgi:hypothetical protein